MVQQIPAHLLVAFPLFKGVAAAITILEKGQRAAGEAGFHVFFDDGFLVLDGYVVTVQLVIHGDSGIAGNVKGFGQGGSPPGFDKVHYCFSVRFMLQIILYIIY